MKKVSFVFLVILSILILCSCNSAEKKNKEAYDSASKAFDDIDAAYQKIDILSSDLYEAWLDGIYSSDEIHSRGVSFLASKMELSQTDLKNGIAAVIMSAYDEDWQQADDDTKAEYKKLVGTILKNAEGEGLYSVCIRGVIKAYEINGTIDEINGLLSNGKATMKEMSEKYSDYEHYPALKGYLTTSTSFFEYCQDPSGSFEQAKETINQYRNDARDYRNDLAFIFEN